MLKASAFRLAAVMSLAAGITACGGGGGSGGDDTDPGPQNQAPIASAGTDQNVEAGTPVALNGSASSDPDGDTLAYAWNQLSGPAVTIDAAGNVTATFVAPTVTASSTLVFRLTVNDGRGGQASDDIAIDVHPAPGPGPDPLSREELIAAGGPVYSANCAACHQQSGAGLPPNFPSIAYSAFVSGNSLPYIRLMLDGENLMPPFSHLSDAEIAAVITYTAASWGNSGETVLPADVTAQRAAVPGSANQPPLANAGFDQTVAPRSNALLDGSASWDGDGTIAQYTWTQIAGPTVSLPEPSSSIAIFCRVAGPGSKCIQQALVYLEIPAATTTTTLSFRLTVTDDDGASSSDTVDIRIDPAAADNQPPIALAGNDQTVRSGSEVTLDGSGSTDPDGSITQFAWQQTNGPVVNLSGALTEQARFTAPAIDSATALAFRLSNPAMPELVGNLSVPGDAVDVAVAGNFAYVVDGVGLQIIDIRDPASMEILVQPASSGAASVEVRGSHAYVVGRPGLQIFNLGRYSATQ